MKKIITIILLAVVSAAAFSQEPNKQLQQLLEYLKKLDMGVHYEQTNFMPSGVQHKWHVMFYETTQKIPADERLSEEQRKQAQAMHDEFIAKRWRNVGSYPGVTKSPPNSSCQPPFRVKVFSNCAAQMGLSLNLVFL